MFAFRLGRWKFRQSETEGELPVPAFIQGGKVSDCDDILGKLLSPPLGR